MRHKFRQHDRCLARKSVTIGTDLYSSTSVSDIYEIISTEVDESVVEVKTSALSDKFLLSRHFTLIREELEFCGWAVSFGFVQTDKGERKTVILRKSAFSSDSSERFSGEMLASLVEGTFARRGCHVTATCDLIGGGHRTFSSRTALHVRAISDRAKRTNTGSKPSRTRLCSGLPTPEEVDRCEAESCGIVPLKRGLESDDAYARRSERHEVARYRRSSFD